MAVIRVPRAFHDAMIEHAVEDAPNECCGLVTSANDAITAVYRATNAERSPYRFRIDPLEYRKLDQRIDDDGFVLGGTYHSHTGSEAIVSPTDIRILGDWLPEPYLHFVVSLKDPATPVVRCWHIAAGDRVEHDIEVTD